MQQIMQGKFSPTKLVQLIDAEELDKAKEYIRKYFFQHKVNVFFFNGESFECYEKHVALKLLPLSAVKYKTINKKTVEVFNARTWIKDAEFMEDTYEPIIDLSTTDLVIRKNGKLYLNMARPRNENVMKVEVKMDEIKDDLKVVYNHIKTVLSDERDDMYEYILNFIACSFGGRKLRTLLYMPCKVERAGRGSILNFLHKILGERMYKTSSLESLTMYTKNLEGRCLINGDELPTDQKGKDTADRIKSLVTEPKFDCRAMHQQAYTQDNTFNIILTSNNDAIRITSSNNSRYVIPRINTKYVGNVEYFTKLNKVLAKPEIQKAFYDDMIERFNTKCKEWNEDVVPDMIAKRKMLIETLPPILKWIKTEYVLKGKNLDCKTSELFNEFRSKTGMKISDQKMGEYLKSVGIESQRLRVNGDRIRKYIRTHAEMLETFQKKNYIDEEYEFVEKDEDTPFIEDAEDPTETKQQITDRTYKDMQKELESMRRRLNDVTNLFMTLKIMEYKQELDTNEHEEDKLNKNWNKYRFLSKETDEKEIFETPLNW